MRGHFGLSVQRQLMASSTALVMMVGASPAMAQMRTFDVPTQSASRAIPTFAKQGGIQIVASGNSVRGKRTNAVRGSYSVEEALRRLLEGTGLTASPLGTNGIITIQAVAAGENPAGSAAADNGSADIVVTGTRVKGGETASPTIELRSDQIRLAGQTDLGEAIRSVPQNFGGGQNPGVGWGASGITNQNMDSSSTANLRGLGGDATLTLLNGHRLSYGSFVQAVDLGAIPLAAVERMEIVPDGASAIYGSDAVGGVVNIILKQGYNGASVAGTVGGATDGGDLQQQYSAVAGKTWKSGNVMAAYSYQSNSAIYASDRSYTAYMPQESTLYPRTVQHSGLVTLRQDITPHVEMRFDATYNNRKSFVSDATNYGLKYVERPDVSSFSLTPSLRGDLGADWSVTVSTTYGQSKSNYDESQYNNEVFQKKSWGYYLNRVVSAEGYVSGKLNGLIAHPIDVVIGTGYRYNSYSYAPSAKPLDAGSVDSYYGFAETAIPLIEPEDDVGLAYRLKVSAAVRYERYPGMASVAVPKFGLIYAPSPAFDVKASWGRSFKAPTLSQQFQQRQAYQYPASWIGGSRFPSGSTVLIDYGGNVDLKPERAETWSATLDIHPPALKGFSASASYFNIVYRDRIVQPVSGAALFNALSDPAYSSFLAYSPASADVQRIIAAASKYYDYSGGTGTSQTVAILYDRYVNAAKQAIHGIDLSAEYRFDLKTASSLTISANAAWLWSRQQTSEGMSEFDLAGTIFNPARLRARGSAMWTDQTWTIGAYLNHIGGLQDNRSTPSVPIHSMTTVDMSARFKFPDGRSVLNGLALQLSAQNLFNQRPPYAAPSGGYSYYVNYDSTNFSPIGRFISFTASKSW